MTALAGPDLDHTSFGVPDALAVARRLRAELGAVPVFGETLPEFRYVTLYAGTTEAGANIELLEPTGPGFLTRFLDARGAGPHHITFTVPDLAASVARVRELGLTVVGESYDHAPWREAFIAPDRVHATVIQLAQTDRPHLPVAELLTTRERRPEDFPIGAGATDLDWWTSLWETAPEGQGRLGATYLGSADLDLSHRLFAGVLGATASEEAGGVRFTWPGGSLLVDATATPGVRGMELAGGPTAGIAIGPALLGL
ncbi:MAG TPA: VOC family protein [Nocardioides sp.]|nr:VOC family protein [Nocardioides sp.]